jgi:hypothetical protein
MADNSSRKFKFISPGVFVNEIDNSQLPAEAGAVGPLLMGAAVKGPLNKPVTVNSFNDFVEVFGNPAAGGKGTDLWRDNSKNAPTYASYAAQAWLRNNSPLTFMRVGEFQDPSTTEEAGFAGWRSGLSMASPAMIDNVNGGGAWGIVVWPSSSLSPGGGDTLKPQLVVSGALAATLYLEAGRVVLSGTRPGLITNLLTASACELYETDANNEIAVGISSDGTAGALEYVNISFNPSSKNYFRRVLNTNPTITNSTITTAATRTANQGGNYWVGESFGYRLATTGTILGSGNRETVASMGLLSSAGVLSGSTPTKYHVGVFPLRDQKGGSYSNQGNDHLYGATRSTTGFFIGQDLSNATGSYVAKSQQKLFRFEALSEGDDVQKQVKISIANLKGPVGAFEEYGSFSVMVRALNDTDANPQILERYDELNLNPASPNYIARIIGDQYEKFDTTTLTNRSYGQYANRSTRIRVVMDEDVERGSVEPEYLPFGVFGPLKNRDFSFISGSGAPEALGTFADSSAGAGTATIFDGGPATLFGALGGIPAAVSGEVQLLSFGSRFTATPGGSTTAQFSASVMMPSMPLRVGSTWGSPKDLRSTYWGAWTGRSPSDTTADPGISDYLTARIKGFQTDPSSTNHDVAGHPTAGSTDPVEISWVFTLDDISGSITSGEYYYVSGSRTNGTSYRGADTYNRLLTGSLSQFTTVLFGGSDGFDVKERDPFRNSLMAGKSDTTSAPLYSLRRAVDMVSDPEMLQYNVIAMPGVTQNLVTNHLLDMVEERADALAIVDLPFVYTADTENSASAESRNSFTVAQAINDLQARNINNSYGAAYYPWVLIQDTINNRTLWAPPSVAAMGALSTTDRIAAPWFAPAGFSRGGLSEGAAGIPVLEVSRRLTSDDRDDLYEANINPIAKFPAEGIVIFGQKTLQQTASALDRINVRRLLIFLKREISFIASRLIFAPNTRDTWTRFTQQATPVLDSVRSQFGIEDFRLILDESTTTPDMIDRNIIYAKLIVKPTRSAEYFAIDFVVTNSGAAFDD